MTNAESNLTFKEGSSDRSNRDENGREVLSKKDKLKQLWKKVTKWRSESYWKEILFENQKESPWISWAYFIGFMGNMETLSDL